METIECSKCGAIFEKTGAKDKLRRFKDKRFMTTFHCPNCDARVILKNGEEPDTLYLKRLERLKEQARRLGDRQEVNELQDEIDQINREIKMNAGKTKDKKFSMKGNDAYDPTKPKNIAKAKALSVAQGKAASDAKVEVKQQSDVGSNQWGIYVDGKLVEGGFFSKSAAEEASVQYSKDEAYDPLDPENIAEEKELAKARGAAAADAKSAIITVGDNNWDIIIMDSTHIKMSLRYSDGKQNFGIPLHINQLSPDFINALKAKGLIKGNYFVEDSRAKDSLFKGQKVTAIKSEQGLREGETYTVLGEEAIIKQVVGEGNTIVYKLQDSSGNVIVIESPEGLFYEVKDSVPPGMLDNVINSSVGRSEGWGNNKKMVEKTLEVLMSQGSIGENSPVSAVINKVRRQMKDEEIGEKEWKNHSDDYLETMEEGNERNNESLKVKIGELQRNMDAARKMGYDTEPYKKEIKKLNNDAGEDVFILPDGKGMYQVFKNGQLIGKYTESEAENVAENLKGKTKDEASNYKGYKIVLNESDGEWRYGVYQGSKKLADGTDFDKQSARISAEDEIDSFLSKDAKTKDEIINYKGVDINYSPYLGYYYVTIQSKYGNGEYSGPGFKSLNEAKEYIDKNKVKGVKDEDINIEELKKRPEFRKRNGELDVVAIHAYLESKARGGKGESQPLNKDSRVKDALMECMECGHKFNRKFTPTTFEVKCPKCGGYDVDVMYGDSSDFYTKDPLTKKGQKILAAMKKVYGEEKGEQVFYASKSKGTISGVDKKTKDYAPEDLVAEYKGHRIYKDKNKGDFVAIKPESNRIKSGATLEEVKRKIDQNVFDSKIKGANGLIGAKISYGNTKGTITNILGGFTGNLVEVTWENGEKAKLNANILKLEPMNVQDEKAICRECGKSYNPDKSDVRNPDNADEFCSSQCEAAHRAGEAEYRMSKDNYREELRKLRDQLEEAKEEGDKSKARDLEIEIADFIKETVDVDYKRMTLKELQDKAKQGYFELQGDPKPRNHVEIKYPNGKKEWVFVEDQEIKIIIGDDPVTHSPAEQKVEGNDVIYKEYTLKQLPETGEFEVYAPGGLIVGHAKALELAKLFVDRIVASRVGDEWSEEARKKL